MGEGCLVTGRRSLGEGLDFYGPALLSLCHFVISGPRRFKQAALGSCCQTPEIISLLGHPHHDGLYPYAMSQTTLLSWGAVCWILGTLNEKCNTWENTSLSRPPSWSPALAWAQLSFLPLSLLPEYFASQGTSSTSVTINPCPQTWDGTSSCWDSLGYMTCFMQHLGRNDVWSFQQQVWSKCLSPSFLSLMSSSICLGSCILWTVPIRLSLARERTFHFESLRFE